MAKKSVSESGRIDMELRAPTRVYLDVCIVGVTPLLFNSYSDNARLTLLMGGKKANKSTVKHNPFMEFRGSATQLGPGADTLLALTSTALKSAMMQAAVDIEDATKAGIGRQVYVHGEYVGIYGTPRLHMAMVRQAGISRAPDVRTRACIAEWAAKFSLSFVSPNLREKSVLNLLVAAGMLAGIGDGRPEKGKLNYGQFEVCAATDKRFTSIVKKGGRAVQVAAMRAAEPFNTETDRFLTAFTSELGERGWQMKDGEIVPLQSEASKKGVGK